MAFGERGGRGGAGAFCKRWLSEHITAQGRADIESRCFLWCCRSCSGLVAAKGRFAHKLARSVSQCHRGHRTVGVTVSQETGVTGGQVSQEAEMAPQSVKDKRYRAALDQVTTSIKKLLVKPGVPDDAPEDTKYMDVGDYFNMQYPTDAEQQGYYKDLIDKLAGLGGARPTMLVGALRTIVAAAVAVVPALTARDHRPLGLLRPRGGPEPMSRTDR